MSSHEALLLFLMAAIAFISPYLGKKLRLPIPVIEILLGILIGTFIKIDKHAFTIIKFISEFGFLVLMYLAGLELDIEDLKKTPKKDFLIYVLYYLIVIGVLFGTAILFNLPIPLVLLVSMSAIGLLYPILSASNALNTNIGRTLLIIGSVGEIISLIIITATTIYYSYGFSIKSVYHISEILFFCIFAYLALKSLKLFSWWYPNTLLKIVSSDNSAETGMRTNFLNMLVFVALAAYLNIEIIIGSFIGGMLYATILKDNEDIREGFEMFGNGFLIPIFFIYVGLVFDINSLTNITTIIYAVSLSIGIFVVRLLASLVFVFADINLRSIIAIPLSTSFPLTLLVAFAEIGKATNILSVEMASAAILTSILTAIIYPPILKVAMKFAR
ncbi:cation:proton antiporter [Deferribacteraceae bacterium V6Fe1]|nr:cation:proton antiporter [Deferribacteraceae bacterium V6Fe1]